MHNVILIKHIWICIFCPFCTLYIIIHILTLHILFLLYSVILVLLIYYYIFWVCFYLPWFNGLGEWRLLVFVRTHYLRTAATALLSDSQGSRSGPALSSSTCGTYTLHGRTQRNGCSTIPLSSSLSSGSTERRRSKQNQANDVKMHKKLLFWSLVTL